jgi:hypothetical protein
VVATPYDEKQMEKDMWEEQLLGYVGCCKQLRTPLDRYCVIVEDPLRWEGWESPPEVRYGGIFGDQG